ncbi:putative N-acetylmannosamine-6-phosphate 2-epimerase [Solirhodobacter olei]|uniref:putative N-acetylmannosamine-6-phosphate 2-epimerase n=1 Tax=Solirhodobacter olei TaxID=2493082 RepID=UPI000FDAB27E|nr:putative N-acetylmannosamine-6-phosphate 2-epimerase [Solirhodobacter olei]
MPREPLLERLAAGLIVSCQPVDGGPMDTTETVVAMALAARDGGARALRIEGASRVAAVRAACDLPIIGIVKRDLDESPVRITPFVRDVRALAEAGATVIAVDATQRVRPVSVSDLLAAIRSTECLAMADLATLDEARSACDLGFDIIGTTMSGYTGGPIPTAPDFELLSVCSRLGTFVIAEGRFNTPALAGSAIEAGADAVCAGSAITRQEYVTRWFGDAIAHANAVRRGTALALDIGGTKSLLALVQNGEILDERTAPTMRRIATEDWFAELRTLAADWAGRYCAVGAAVTGVVREGRWSALNSDTLDIPPETPLAERLAEIFQCDSALAVNDAQAAAWGEYRYGAGRGTDMAFVTVSSGIGGGIVIGGQLWRGSRGLAGSLGQTRLTDGTRLESFASGFAMSRRAGTEGWPDDTRAIFSALADGEPWAASIIADAAGEVARALVNLQAIADIERVVLGGGVGLLPSYQARLQGALKAYPSIFLPVIVPAALGAKAGVVGVADLALRGSQRGSA